MVSQYVNAPMGKPLMRLSINAAVCSLVQMNSRWNLGHAPELHPRWTRQNVLRIDTGVHVPDYGHLTIAQIESGEPQVHRFARREGLAMSARDDG